MAIDAEITRHNDAGRPTDKHPKPSRVGCAIFLKTSSRQDPRQRERQDQDGDHGEKGAPRERDALTVGMGAFGALSLQKTHLSVAWCSEDFVRSSAACRSTVRQRRSVISPRSRRRPATLASARAMARPRTEGVAKDSSAYLSIRKTSSP